MIDWNALIKPEDEEQNPVNDAESRNKTGFVGTENDESRNTESIHSCGFNDFVPTVPTVPTSFLGGGKENENHAPGEGGASDNFCAAKTHPINPIAVTLLLTCCNKATVSKEEILEAIWKLQTIPQSEQIKSWAILCQSYGINPHKAIRPFTEHRGTGTSCQGCKHISMELIPNDGRPVYRYVCGKQHHILEALYIGERVLIAPESCKDCQTKSGKLP